MPICNNPEYNLKFARCSTLKVTFFTVVESVLSIFFLSRQVRKFWFLGFFGSVSPGFPFFKMLYFTSWARIEIGWLLHVSAMSEFSTWDCVNYKRAPSAINLLVIRRIRSYSGFETVDQLGSFDEIPKTKKSHATVLLRKVCSIVVSSKNVNVFCAVHL